MSLNKIKDFARQYQTDASFRADVDANPHAAFRKIGLPIPEGTEVKFIQSTDSTTYVALPPDPNTEVQDESLENLAAGNGASCLSTWPSCLSSYDAGDVH